MRSAECALISHACGQTAEAPALERLPRKPAGKRVRGGQWLLADSLRQAAEELPLAD